MGINFFGSSTRCDIGIPAPTDPDPKNFKIVEIYEGSKYLMATVEYPNCTNFEGTKIILMKDTTKKELEKMNKIDPHFLTSNNIIARFRPTFEGISLAVEMAG